MASLGRVLEIALGVWFAALAGVIVFQLFSGRILSTGVLAIPHGPPISVARLQLVLMTIGIAAAYAGTALMRAPGEALPEPPLGVVLALLGSNGFYLGGKMGFLQGKGMRR